MAIVVASTEDIQHPFFGDLVRLMKNQEFRKFYDTHFKDWNEIQSMVFFMKLYSSIEYEYNERFSRTISDIEMGCMLEKIMSDSYTRSMAMELFQEFKASVDYKKTKQFRTLLQFEHD